MNALLYAFYVIVALGMLLLVHSILRRRNFLEVGLFLGVVLIGLLAISSFYFSFSDLFLGLAGVVGIVFGITLAFFILGKNIRVLSLLGAVPILIVQAFVYPLPSPTLAAYFLIVVIILNSYDNSRVDVTTCMKSADRYLRVTLLPFSLIERGIKKLRDQQSSQQILALTYFFFTSVVFIVAPFVIIWATKTSILVEYFVLGSLGYLVLAREQCGRGMREAG